MDIAALKTELATDPLKRGYSGMNDAEVEASLNAVNRTIKTAITPREFAYWLATRFDKIAAAQTDATGTNASRSAARYLNLLAAGGLGIEANATDVAAVNVLVAANVITARDRATLASDTPCSRAVELFGEAVTNQHVYLARN